MFRKFFPKNSNKRTLANLKKNDDFTTKLSNKKRRKRNKKQPATNVKKEKGHLTGMCINSIMTKSRIHYMGQKAGSQNKLVKPKKKKTRKAFWTSFVTNLDTLSIPIVTRNMSRHFDTWKQCLPRSNEDRLTQMGDGKNFPLWNYRSGIITRALAKKVDIGQINSLFAKLPASTIQTNTKQLNETSNDTKKMGQLQENISDKFLKKEPVRDETRTLVTRTRKLHLRNKVLSYIYQDAKVWWGCGDANNQKSSAPIAAENKPKSARSDVCVPCGEPSLRRIRPNKSDQLSDGCSRPRQITLKNQLSTLDTLAIPIVTRNISRLFETWQQHLPRNRQDLQSQLTEGALWYHESDITRRTLTKSLEKPSTDNSYQPSVHHPNQVQYESSEDPRENLIPRQMDSHSKVRVGIRRSDNQSMISRSRKLHLRNKVLSHIYQDAKKWWGRGDSTTVDSASKVLENEQASGSLESMAPGDNLRFQ